MTLLLLLSCIAASTPIPANIVAAPPPFPLLFQEQAVPPALVWALHAIGAITWKQRRPIEEQFAPERGPNPGWAFSLKTLAGIAGGVTSLYYLGAGHKTMSLGIAMATALLCRWMSQEESRLWLMFEDRLKPIDESGLPGKYLSTNMRPQSSGENKPRRHPEIEVAKAMLQRKETRNAIDYLKQLETEHPKSTSIKKWLGLALMMDNQYEDAITVYEQKAMIEMERGEYGYLAQTQLNIKEAWSRSFLHKGRLDEAQAESDRLIEANPELQLGWWIRYRVAMARPEYHKAQDAANHLVNLAPNSGNHLSLALASYYAGDLALATREVNAVRALTPSQPMILLLHSILAFETGDKAVSRDGMTLVGEILRDVKVKPMAEIASLLLQNNDPEALGIMQSLLHAIEVKYYPERVTLYGFGSQDERPSPLAAFIPLLGVSSLLHRFSGITRFPMELNHWMSMHHDLVWLMSGFGALVVLASSAKLRLNCRLSLQSA